MSKRGLYPTLSTKEGDDKVRLMMNFISFCDGQTSLLKISESLNVPIWELYDIVDKLKSYSLISTKE